MSETESTQTAGETSANLPASAPGVQPSSLDRDQLRKELKAEILAELKGDKSLMQSMKDQTIEQVKKDKGFKTLLDEYRAMKQENMTDREIEREFRLRELEAERTQQPAPVAPGSATDSGASDLEDLLPALNLEADDVDALRILAQPLTDIAKAKELAKLSQRRKESPNPAAAAQPASAPAPKIDVSGKVKRYMELSKSPTANSAELSALKKELDAANWGQ